MSDGQPATVDAAMIFDGVAYPSPASGHAAIKTGRVRQRNAAPPMIFGPFTFRSARPGDDIAGSKQ